MGLEVLISDLGDLACVGATAAVVGLWVLRRGGRAPAAAFGLFFLIAALSVAGLKWVMADLLNLPMPDHSALWSLSRGSPSGHAAMTVFVYGFAAALCRQDAGRLMASLGIIACIAAILGVLVTRVTLGCHTLADVLAGYALGAVLLVGPVWTLYAQPLKVRPGAGGLIMALVVANTVMLLSGIRVTKDFGVL